MKLSDWLKRSESILLGADIITARLDCLVLLSDELGKDKSWVLAHPEFELQRSEIEILNTNIVQRAQHVPLAYIRGRAEFYGREFTVNEHALVPRPETETMIALVCELVSGELASEKALLIDVGTGSGAIAITSKLELPEVEVIATDIDENCLEVATENARNLNANIEFLQGNLLEPLATRQLANSLTILLCNLPYLPTDFRINTAATHEPKHAIFGGADGLDLYRKMFEQIKTNAWKPQYILAESLPTQHNALAAIAKAANYSLQKSDDFIQLFSHS